MELLLVLSKPPNKQSQPALLRMRGSHRAEDEIIQWQGGINHHQLKRYSIKEHEKLANLYEYSALLFSAPLERSSG